MDIQMPVMNGWDATHHIRQDLLEADQPVIIAMTAGAIEGEVEACLAAGMDDYLSKPLTIDALAETMSRWHGMRHVVA